MNICLLNDSFPPVIDGVANVVMNYGEVLTDKYGANVTVATPRYPDTDYGLYPYRVIDYPSFDTTDFIKGYRTGNPLAIREIAEIVGGSPDIIHSHCPASSTILARILRKETGRPIIFTYHTKFDVDIARAVGEGILGKETIKTMVKNIEACDDVWVVSKGAGKNLESLGFEGEYRVMPNGVDFPKGKVSDKEAAAASEGYDLPKGVPLFLFVGRIMKYKGLPLILDALKLLHDNGTDFRMVFVGGGADLEEMQTLAKEYNIDNKVIFTGPEHDREKLRAWNTRADLFLFPSVYDTNGIVVREAAACGLASVLIKDSCAAEGISHDRNGFIIDETPKAMAELLTRLAADPDHMKDVGMHAMDEIYISWEDAVGIAYKRYEEIHEMALRGDFGHRKHQSLEYLTNSAAMVLNGTRKVFVDQPRTIYEGMRDNFQEFTDNLKGNLDDLTNGIRDNLESMRTDIKDNIDTMRTDIKDNIKEMRSDIRENFEDLTTDVKDGFEKFRGKIDEFTNSDKE